MHLCSYSMRQTCGQFNAAHRPEGAVFASFIAILAPRMVEAVYGDVGCWGQDVRSRGSRHHLHRSSSKLNGESRCYAMTRLFVGVNM